jgi:hypothetical protein
MFSCCIHHLAIAARLNSHLAHRQQSAVKYNVHSAQQLSATVVGVAAACCLQDNAHEELGARP